MHSEDRSCATLLMLIGRSNSRRPVAEHHEIASTNIPSVPLKRMLKERMQMDFSTDQNAGIIVLSGNS